MKDYKNKIRIGRVYANFQTDMLYTEHYLSKEMSIIGHETVFITSDKYLSSWNKYLKHIDKAGYYKFPFFEVIRIKAFFPLEKAIFKNPNELKKLIFSSNFDILHLYGLGTFSTLIVLILLKINRNKKIPVIVSDHSDTRTHKRDGILADFYNLFFKAMLFFVKDRISRVVTFSNVGSTLLSKKYRIRKKYFSEIPLGFDHETFFYQEILKNKEVKFVLGYAGKIDSKKRIDYLINQIEGFEFKSNIKLIIVGIQNGDEYSDYITTVASRCSFEIELRPFANSIELANFYNYIDLAVYPGGISITTIEANGCGTPVLIYKSIDGLEIRVTNGRGRLFITNEEFRECLTKFYNEYVEVNVNNIHISNVTRDTCSWRVIKDQYLNLYYEISK